MAVKFSQFTEEAGAANVTRLVGFTATGNLNIQIPPANIDTLVTSNTAQSGTSATYTLSGTKTGTATTTDLTTYTVPANSGMALTAGTNTIAFDATSYKLTSTNTSPAGTVPLVLTGTGGGDAGLDTVNLVGTGTVGITSSGNTITINGTGGGGGGAVTSFTNANGTYVSAVTVNTAATGAITTGIIDLSAVDGTSNVTTRFLSKDNTWDVPTYTVDSTYTLPITGSSGAVTATLTGSGGDTDPVLITGGTNVTFSSITAAGFTIDAAGGGGGSGTVTSIGMTVPAAFAVTPASITTSGTFAISGAGSASQVVLGNGTLGTLPTDTNTTYTVDVPAGTTSINLKGSDATDDPIVLVGGTDIGLVRDSANQITINSQAVGGVTSVDEIAAGTSTGIPIIVSPTTGAVKIQSMAFSGAAKVGHVPSSDAAGQTTDFLRADGTWATPASAGISIDKQTFTGNGTLTDFTLTTAAGCTADNLNIYISGVYQNSVDASNAVTYTVGSGLNPILQFVSAGTATAPPVTATRGIEVVITR